MNKTYNFYCDESTHLEYDNMPYMLIAYTSCAYNELDIHKKAIKGIKEKYKVKGEIKWNSISNSMYPFYSELIDYFFATDLHFRSVIIDKSKIDKEKYGLSHNDFYFRMYYQLLHHKINMSYTYNVYLDIKDTNSNKKISTLKNVLNIKYSSIRNLQFMRSHESSLMQLTDLLMGAINYFLRGENKVIAKTKLIEKIQKKSENVFAKSTSKNVDKFNLFFIDLN